MQYELICGSNRGVQIDQTPIMRDVRDTFEVSFLLPNAGAYLALFVDTDGIEYRKPLVSGKVKVPSDLLIKDKTQHIGLVVCEIDGEQILNSWECEPLMITAFLDMRQTQRQLSTGITDQDRRKRLIELERSHAQTINDFAALKEEIAQKDTRLMLELKKFYTDLNGSVEQYRGETTKYVDSLVKELDERKKALAESQAEKENLAKTVKTISENQTILQDNIKNLYETIESLK